MIHDTYAVIFILMYNMLRLHNIFFIYLHIPVSHSQRKIKDGHPITAVKRYVVRTLNNNIYLGIDYLIVIKIFLNDQKFLSYGKMKNSNKNISGKTR